MKRAFGQLAMVFLLAACSETTSVVHIDYLPQQGIVPTERAGTVELAVSVRDARTAERGFVGIKKDSAGRERAPILSDRSVLLVLQDAVSTELEARGYRLQSNGATIDLALVRFNSEFQLGLFAGDAHAEVSFDADVRGDGDELFYSRHIRGLAQDTDGLGMTAGSAEEALELALADAVTKLMADPAFIESLETAARSIGARGT